VFGCWQKAALTVGVAFALAGCAEQRLPVGSLNPVPMPAKMQLGNTLGLAPATPMPIGGGEAVIPPGYVGFCSRMPEQCKIPADAAPSIALTPEIAQTLQAINRDVNNSIWPEDDLRHYGRAEYWTIPTDGYGDCEDYALTKRQKLVEAGLSPASLRLAVVITAAQERHAVLTVVTDKGDYVLDNLRDVVTSWDAIKYFWIERQTASDPLTWISLKEDDHLKIASR
jgi:predicted transglutaminase-like cysteine proteinase